MDMEEKIHDYLHRRTIRDFGPEAMELFDLMVAAGANLDDAAKAAISIRRNSTPSQTHAPAASAVDP